MSHGNKGCNSDRLKKYNKRPSVDLKNPDINIHIHISEYKYNLSLNSSGESYINVAMN